MSRKAGFDGWQFRKAASALFGFEFSPEQGQDPGNLRLSVGLDERERRAYCLLAAQYFAAAGWEKVALAWRIKHAVEVGVVAQPSKVRFAAVELTDPSSIARAEAHTRDLIRLMERGRSEPHEEPPATEVAVPDAEDNEMSKQIEALTKVTADLLAVVAAQQREIEEIRRQLDAAAMSRVQTEVTKLVQEHHKAMLAEARETIGALGLASGEVTVGEAEHRGSVVVKLARSSEEGRTGATASKGADAGKVDVAAEVRGLAARLASVGVDVSSETSRVRERAELAEQSRASAESQRFEGTFESKQKGVTIRWNR